jgi:hypothetical protein
VRHQSQPNPAPPAQIYGFEFAALDLEALTAKPKAQAKSEPADDIDYGPMHRAIQRDREWYR